METKALEFFIACVTAAGFGIAIAAFGCGIAQGIGLRAAVEGIARNPESSGKVTVTMLIGLALIESSSGSAIPFFSALKSRRCVSPTERAVSVRRILPFFVVFDPASAMLKMRLCCWALIRSVTPSFRYRQPMGPAQNTFVPGF